MLTHKYIDKICCIAAILSLIVTILFMNAESFGVAEASKIKGYETRLFDASTVHTIDIVMDDWDSFIDTCTNEEYALCSVVIDNEVYKNVAIRAKGNTSLTQVDRYGNDRYSFKIEFDHYDSTKSYYGLDKLSLNNIIQDNTYMKDFLTYQMMQKFGADAPLCSYANITVNGEDWGLYLAVESIEEAFLERNYGSDYGELYKPDSTNMGGGRGNGDKFDMADWTAKLNEETISEMKNTLEKTDDAQLTDCLLYTSLDMWVEEELKPGSLSDGTVTAYINTVSRIKKHPIGKRKLKTVTSDHLQSYMDLLSFGGTDPDGKTVEALSKGSLGQYSAVLQNSFRFAVFPKRLITFNPMQYVVKRIKGDEYELFTEDGTGDLPAETPTISHEQYLALNELLKKKHNPALLPIQIAYFAGLRIGEVCGLTWQDIDLKEQCLTIRRSMRYDSVRKKTQIGPTKRKKIRTVDFCDTLAVILREAKKEQMLNSIKYGPLYSQNYYRIVKEKNRTYYEVYSLPRTETPPEDYTQVSQTVGKSEHDCNNFVRKDTEQCRNLERGTSKPLQTVDDTPVLRSQILYFILIYQN